MATLTNADVLAGKGTGWAARIYRELVAEYGHDALCDAYGLDRDDVSGGTYWGDIVTQAVLHGVEHAACLGVFGSLGGSGGKRYP